MKKYLYFAVVATLFAACSQYEETAFVGEMPKTLTVGFCEDESRVQLSENKTVWTAGDCLSVFCKSTGNECWQFDGSTGDTTGTLTKVSGSASGTAIENIVAVYPYSATNTISADGKISVTVADTQNYTENSYGVGANLMVGKGCGTDVSMKSVCGWLKLQFSGTDKVTKITVQGNNGEKLSGAAVVDAESLAVSFDGSATDRIVVLCGDGVQLSATSTAFYVALAPQTFTNGISVVAECESGAMVNKSTDKTITITRNHILPMSDIDADEERSIPLNEIWYTSSDGEIVAPQDDVFDANIVSNTYKNGIGKIVFDGNITKIGSSAFYYRSSLTSVIIPDSVTSIGDDAFWSCSSLTSVTIPDSVTSIGDDAFWSCSSLTSVTIPDSVTEIGGAVFSGCSSLTAIYSKYASADKRCLIIDGTLNSFAPAELTEYTIPDNVTSIGRSAFDGCSSLTSITIGNSVTSIGEYAFWSCSSLTSVTIPDSVTEIGGAVFSGCSSLTAIYSKYASADKRCLIIDGTLNSFAPAELTEYTIPDNVTSIGRAAFDGCSSLTSITIGNSVTSIGEYAFYNCTGLTSVIIGNSVTSIGYDAFDGCSSLTSITIPDSVTSIRWYAFSGCSSLTSVYCKPTTPPTGDSSMFGGNASGRKIYVPSGSVSAYKVADGWSDYSSDIVGYDF